MADEGWIVSAPDMLGGKPHVRGTRLSVELLLELMAQGATQGEILEEYEQLTAEGLRAALRYAAWSVSNDLTWDASVSA